MATGEKRKWAPRLSHDFTDGWAHAVVPYGSDGTPYSTTSGRQDVNIYYSDSPSIDAFGRLRVGAPQTLFDSNFVADDRPLKWDSATNGTGTATHSAARSSVQLSVTASGDYAYLQSRQRIVYQPGKSLLTLATSVPPGAVENVRWRLGKFCANDGTFIEHNGTTARLVVRSSVSGSPVDTAANQADWNIDPFDGTGPSGVTLDWSKAQIVLFDYEWLGVGRVRVGFVVDGLVYYAHQFIHANTASAVYMKHANGPMRYEIEATGTPAATATLEAICSAVSSEGGYEPTGITSTANRGGTAATVAAGARGEVIALRLKSARVNNSVAEPQKVSVVVDSAGVYLWELRVNPTGLSGGSWVSETNSDVEYNVSRTGTPAGGFPVDSGYFTQQSGGVVLLETQQVLGSALDGTADVWSLLVTNTGAGNRSVYGGISWRELR